jgi:hypothetical protein
VEKKSGRAKLHSGIVSEVSIDKTLAQVEARTGASGQLTTDPADLKMADLPTFGGEQLYIWRGIGTERLYVLFRSGKSAGAAYRSR